jgi:hypothetical protein
VTQTKSPPAKPERFKPRLCSGLDGTDRVGWNFGCAADFHQRSATLLEGGEMVLLGHEAMMLTFEANGVIGLRLMKIARGRADARHEVMLMVQEK